MRAFAFVFAQEIGEIGFGRVWRAEGRAWRHKIRDIDYSTVEICVTQQRKNVKYPSKHGVLLHCCSSPVDRVFEAAAGRTFLIFLLEVAWLIIDIPRELKLPARHDGAIPNTTRMTAVFPRELLAQFCA